MPRHPPNAQKNKQQQHTTKQTLPQKTYSKMLASTIQFTTNPPTPTPHHPQNRQQKSRPGNQGALPQNPDSMPPPHTQTPRTREHPPPPKQAAAGVSPTPTHGNQPPHPRHTSEKQEQQPAAFRRSSPGRPRPPTAQTTTNNQEATPTQPILRKEVIQPHLPVRLPCYDFVPITGPAFDRSPWGHGLRASPTFMT